MTALILKLTCYMYLLILLRNVRTLDSHLQLHLPQHKATQKQVLPGKIQYCHSEFECDDTAIREDQNFEETITADEISFLESDLTKVRKDVISVAGDVKRGSTNRMTIRRKEVFQDYLEARRKRWFTQGAILKISFAGEPAIDGGGPRREFFTGKKFVTFNQIWSNEYIMGRIVSVITYQIGRYTLLSQ